jgi:hypothetical protein
MHDAGTEEREFRLATGSLGEVLQKIVAIFLKQVV